MWFNKQKPSVAESEAAFYRDFCMVLKAARLVGVSERKIADVLLSHGKAIERQFQHARVLRNHKLEGNSVVVSR
jgi:hypothetical protein